MTFGALELTFHHVTHEILWISADTKEFQTAPVTNAWKVLWVAIQTRWPSLTSCCPSATYGCTLPSSNSRWADSEVFSDSKSWLHGGCWHQLYPENFDFSLHSEM